MRDYYKLTFPITTSFRKTSQKLLLLSAIAIDIGNFFVLIDCIFGSLYYLILLFGLFVLSTILRIVSIYCNYTYLYIFNNGQFMVYKAYSIKSKKMFCITDNKQFSLVESCGKEIDAKILYNLSCDYQKYLLTVGNKKYIIAIDAYMHALISGQIGKETDHDIS